MYFRTFLGKAIDYLSPRALIAIHDVFHPPLSHRKKQTCKGDVIRATRFHTLITPATGNQRAAPVHRAKFVPSAPPCLQGDARSPL
ncbi:hypothetical protein M404DRAFT_996207 [Pisolithus tinctorius Marx 270]|uniref:Uncharacterized protein n=1 Tax=Pisolithus tinctorius Marx 270 TaxID=870435 RepID=A0A0C3P7K5_PISTI|nr:hypothetical protein M404DRAFT_996207 [Pisolithus tinctorius Marx 270]